ncbi:alpha-L-rhamnosidase [Aeromicrobium sp. CFBP 8757]|uniref:glycosyl hydrolase n=1 Tax=Aeromicrobium sp. CFBP 8757 TaxID=2775288 RepID=UPI0017839571|nr:glycosyl hydrolase [Aeromicrobium sp. CFBP 8757]MBD8607583.1 alpha-L-rhamnosidase [Aeromicrobium sp. CFBP 8757]
MNDDTTDPSTTGSGPSRRRVLQVSAAAGLGMLAAPVLPGSPGAATGGGGSFERRFASPPTSAGARFRWWWPNGHVTPSEIAREVKQVAEAGFGGLEVADVHHSVRSGLDPAGHGWATEPWIAGLDAALTQAGREGITIDVTAGPSWPAAVPTVQPDSPVASHELAHGLATVAAGQTFDGRLPDPVVEASRGVTRSTLVRVQAVRLVTPSTRESVLDRASLIDLTDRVVAGTITWTAPTEGSWLLLAYWERGSGQMPEAGPHTSPDSYVIDHFSRAATDALTSYWDRRILSPRIARLLRRSGSTFFEDSLEIETDATIWTPGFLEAFRANRGYDLAPYLPIMLEVDEKYLYTFDTDRTSRVRDDVAQVFSDLYRDHHLVPARDWAHRQGLRLRIQAYGLETDTLAYSGLLDVPETESLGFKNLDDYRVMAGGRDLGGRTILSCEAAAYNGSAYNVTWDRVLTTVNSIYAAGVNQAVLHGFAYAEAPGAAWPGFAAFSPYGNNTPGFSEAWGPRQPSWAHVPDIAAYLKRTQWVLQTGTNSVDLVYYRQKGWAATGIGALWATNDGIPLGWSHSFISSDVLGWRSASLRRGRLAPDGPAYKAMIIEGDAFRGRRATLTVAAARRVAELAAAGFPIVFLGDWSTPTAEGLGSAADDATVAAAVRSAQGRPSVRTVALPADVPGALAALRVRPHVTHERSTLVHVHRRTDDADFFYVANARHAENRKLETVDQTVWFDRRDARQVPFVLDAWTGEVRRIARYQRDGDRIGVRLRLLAGQSTVVVLAGSSWAAASSRRVPQVVSTEADDIRVDGSRLVLRSSRQGTFVTVLGDSRSRRTTVGAVPAERPLTSWTLEVEDWQPGSRPSTTRKPVVRRTLSALVPWLEIPGLEDVSGIGRYTTVVDWDAARHVGAHLDLGSVLGSFRVRVNGRRVPGTNPLDTVVDLGDSLRRGRNTVEVEVASTLLNRLRTAQAVVFGSSARQRYGLVGPVTLRPYGTAEVRA